MDIERVDWMGYDRIRIRRARIVNIEFERRRASITIVYRDDNRNGQRQQLVLLTTRDTKILDEDRNTIRARELRKGMIINAVVSSRFTRSIPPQTEAFRIVVKKDVEETYTSEGYILFMDLRRSEIMVVEFKDDESYDLSLFRVTDKTKIKNSRNQPITLEDLRRGMQVTVEHSAFDTRVFPPTAEAYKIEQK